MTLGEDLDVAAEKARQLETSYMALSADLAEARSTVEDLQLKLTECQAQIPTPVKPSLLTGLLSRSVPPPMGLSGWNPEIKWKDLEPTRGAFDLSSIDAALVKNPNARIRLMCGIHSPEWVKALSGGGVLIESSQSPQVQGTVPRYWSTDVGGDDYWDRYDLLVSTIDRKYGPTIKALFMAGSMIQYAEPFLHQMANKLTHDNLLAAGWTPLKDKTAQMRMIQSHKMVTGTRNAVAVNGYQSLDANGNIVQDLTFTKLWMDAFKAAFPDGIGGNNSIRESMIGDNAKPGGFYQLLDQWPIELYFQCATWDRIAVKGSTATTQERHDGLVKTMAWAESMGAHAFELPGGHNLTANEISDWDARFKANA